MFTQKYARSQFFKVFITTSSLLATGCGLIPPNNANSNDNSSEYPYDDTTYGALIPLPEEIKTFPKAINPRSFPSPAGLTQAFSSPTLPPSALLSNTPPIGQQGPCSLCNGQGSPGSCIAWSFAYGLGSYTANVTQNWGINNPDNLISPAFIYEFVLNEQQKSCPSGTEGKLYLKYLAQNGAVSLTTAPYNANCADLNNTNLNDPPNADFRIGSWTYISPTDRDLIKQTLAAGQAVAFAGHLYEGFGELTGSDVYYGSGPFEKNKTTGKLVGHGMLLIGYDDTQGDPSQGLGAYRIQNSFGTSWGDSGYLWMSYGTFESSILATFTAVPLEAPLPAIATLTPDVTAVAAPARLVQAFQTSKVEADSTTRVYLVFRHQFDAPVEVGTVTVTDPSGTRAVHAYNVWHNNGYSHISRTDGAQFLAGTYQLSMTVRLLDESTVTYSGSVNVDALGSSALPAAAITGGVFGGTGEPASVE